MRWMSEAKGHMIIEGRLSAMDERDEGNRGQEVDPH